MPTRSTLLLYSLPDRRREGESGRRGQLVRCSLVQPPPDVPHPPARQILFCSAGIPMPPES